MKTPGSIVLAILLGGTLVGPGIQGPAVLAEDSDVARDRRVPVLVELFTSQGCVSCPPADRLLEKLARKQPVSGVEIIPLAFHVDYWDHLGWKDPFSSVNATSRQRQYISASDHNSLFTPLMMVDGREGFVGHDQASALFAIENARTTPKARVELTEARIEGRDDTRFLVATIRVRDVPEDQMIEGARVFLVVAEDAIETDVLRGENAGHTLSHWAVVRDSRELGGFRATEPRTFWASTTIQLDPVWKIPNLSAVAWVQDATTHATLGATRVQLRGLPRSQ